MRVVYAATRNLYPYLVPTLCSLLEHNDPEVVYIMAEDDRLPYELPDVCKVVNVSGQTWVKRDGPNKDSIFTYMAMCRACYCEIFPDESKLLQLDVDTIICDSLQPLWDIDLTGKWFAACQEYKGTYKPFGGTRYYNIGVAVFNLDEMRKDNVMQRVLDVVNTQKLSCTEQDAFNMLGIEANKIVDIPVRFNESRVTDTTKNPAIVHYAGVRNWYENRKMPRRNYLEPYLDYLNA